jgi:hypothetical protein
MIVRARRKEAHTLIGVCDLRGRATSARYSHPEPNLAADTCSEEQDRTSGAGRFKDDRESKQ